MPVKTIDYKGYSIAIEHDEYPCNPLTEFDNFAEIACFHRSYELSTKGAISDRDELQDHLNSGAVEFLPIYMYDHSGVTISTTPFSCRWDSGMIGFIYVNHDKLLNEYAAPTLSPELKQQAHEHMRGEIKQLDDYLTGNVYGYVCSKDGQEIDSCWGFYGDYDSSGIIDEAKSVIDWHINTKLRSHYKQLKRWIRSQVPLRYRQPALY